ncbi:MAG: choice-of-anchor A family protein, partial [Oscillospiraceae bacterium]|nr:choice-of-anchor A family protein [Oscillospiraceae bacterium]
MKEKTLNIGKSIRKKRFVSFFTAMFIVVSALGDCLPVLAEFASNIDGIEDVTGNAEKNKELLDVENPDDLFLGIAGNFTIFVKEKFVIPEASADIEGRLAAGGGIVNERGGTSTYTVGNKYTGNGATVILGGGTLDRLDIGTPEKNRKFVITSDTDITPETTLVKENTYISDDIIDFDAEFTKLDSLSSSLAEKEVTGTVEFGAWGNVVLRGNNEGLNIFNITEEQWNLIHEYKSPISIYVPGDAYKSYVVMNIEGTEIEMPATSISFFDEVHQGPVLVHQDTSTEPNAQLCGNILYNIPQAQSVHYNGSIQGSLLAVNANVSGEEGGHVSGSVIAKSAEKFGIQAGSITFNPPESVIEDSKPVSKISISKIGGDNGAGLSGAVMKITSSVDLSEAGVKSFYAKDVVVEGNTLTWTTEFFPAQFTHLPDGEYTITEVSAPKGYELAKPVKFTIVDAKVDGVINKTITITDEIRTPKDVKFSKTDISGKELPGAVLVLSSTSGNELSSFVTEQIKHYNSMANTLTWTTTDTPVVFTDLPDGDYTLEEIDVPAGYMLAEKISFKIIGGSVYYETSTVAEADQNKVDSDTNTVTVVNKVMQLQIFKKDENGNPLPGADMAITNTDGTSMVGVTADTEIVVKDTPNEKYVIRWHSTDKPVVFTGLPDGNYTLSEVTAPAGYELFDNVDFKVVNGIAEGFNGNVIEVTDRKTPEASQIYISKTDMSGADEVKGAVLKLTLSGGGKLPAIESSNPTLTSDENSIIFTSQSVPTSIKGLPDGTYVLSESVAPDKYTITGNIEFTIKNGKIEGTTDNAVKMKDELSKITVSKKDISGTKEIAGARLVVTLKEATKTKIGADLGDGTVTVTGGASAVSTSPDSVTFLSGNEPAVITGLPDGKYTLTEITSPDGYTINEETVNFEIINGVVVSGASVQMLDRPSEIKISKTDVAGAEIPGATLTLTLTKPAKTENADLTGTGEPTVEGDPKAVSWVSGTSPKVLTNVPDGEYTLREDQAPLGYEIAEEITFTVVNGKVSEFADNTVIMIDALTPELSEVIISKTDVTGATEVPGAKLTLTGTADLSSVTSDGAITVNSNVITWTSSDKPVKFVGLPDGKYTLEESVAPDGYTITGKVEFELVDGKVQGSESNTVKMINEYSKVTISKQDIAGAELPGAILTLTGEKSLANVTSESEIKVTENSITWTSGKTPTVLTGLPNGKYTLREDQAPLGYEIAEEITFTVVNGKVSEFKDDTIIMTDVLKPEPSEVLISKTDVTGVTEVPGAKLTLTGTADLSSVTSDSEITVDGKVITWTSNDKPVKLTGLPDGKYTLEESVAPDGYTVTGKVEFELVEGKIQGSESNTVKMLDEYSEVTISKKAINGTEEL